MAHAPARCPSTRGSGDGEMGKPRKVALITGITGQVTHSEGGQPPCCEDMQAACVEAPLHPATATCEWATLEVGLPMPATPPDDFSPSQHLDYIFIGDPERICYLPCFLGTGRPSPVAGMVAEDDAESSDIFYKHMRSCQKEAFQKREH